MKGHDLINTLLPDELILEIFNHLDESKATCDSCSLVCKRWLKLDRLSRGMLRIGTSGNPDAIVKLLLEKFVDVRNVCFDVRLPIAMPTHFGSSVGRRVRRPASRKRRRGSEIAGLSAKSLASKNNVFEESDLEQNSLSDAGLIALAEAARLEKLSLIWCSNVTSAGLISIAEKCRSLKSLDLQFFLQSMWWYE